MKRWFNKTVCITLMLFMLLTGGCFKKDDSSVGVIETGCKKRKLYEYGDFIITEDNEIYDFSDQGLQKEYIIFPKTINGNRIRVVAEGWVSPKPMSFRYNENIKKIYELNNIITSKTEGVVCGYWSKEDLKKVVLAGTEYLISTKKHKIFCNGEIYYYTNYTTLKKLCENGIDFEKYDCKNNKRIVCAYQKSDNTYEKICFLANIEFMYNYEGAPNKGHYWIDDLETGETLSYIPPNPTREGYTFDGWYADSECTIKYDFSKPYIMNELLKGESQWYRYIENYEKEYYMLNYLYYPEDYVTFIYAKWVEN